MTLQELLKEYKSKTGYNNETIGQLLGLSKSTVARWSNGETKILQSDTKTKLSKLIGIDVDIALNEQIFFLKKPVLGIVKAGYDLLADQNIQGYMEVSQKDSEKGDFFLKVQGDSMDLAKIHNNDMIYVKKCDNVPNGTIAVVMIGEEVTVKKVIKKDNLFILEAANPNYENKYFTPQEVEELPVKVIGKVLYSRSDF